MIRYARAWLARWPVTAFDVAVTRIVVALLLGFTAEVERAVHIASASRAHWIAPAGLGWFLQVAPLDVDTVKLVRLVHWNASALAVVGLFTRPMLALSCCTGFYLFALHQVSGAVLHDMHLLWFAAVLAAGSAGEALSVDAWLASRRVLGPRQPRLRHALTLASIGTLLGVVYFFPGAWKLGASGLAWAWSDNLANQMHAKWLQYGVIPAPRVDRLPWLLHLGASLALLFELGFLFLVQWGTRTRVVLALAGLAFHGAIQHFLLIRFSALWLCYVALIPWRSWFSRERSRAPSVRWLRGRWPRMSVMLLLAMLVVLGERGVRGQTQSFPFACYPTFHRRLGPELHDLRVLALDATGAAREVPIARDERGARTQAQWGTVWSLAGIYGVPFERARLQRYFRAEYTRPHVRAVLEGATEIRVELVLRPTAPEAWEQPPRILRELTRFDSLE